MDNRRQKDTSPTPTIRTASTTTPFPSPVRDNGEDLGGSDVSGRRLTAADVLRYWQGWHFESGSLEDDFKQVRLDGSQEEFLIQWLPDPSDFYEARTQDVDKAGREDMQNSEEVSSDAKKMWKANKLLMPLGPLSYRPKIDGPSSANFICVPRIPLEVFYLAVEDDADFCLVKRILGKGGCNMKTMALEHHAKIRLRGRGSGFLEGAAELDMPLQIHLSCSAWNMYRMAFVDLYELIEGIYWHYRRYANAKSMEVPNLEVTFTELRRRDHGLELPGDQAKSATKVNQNLPVEVKPHTVKINKTEVILPVGCHPSGQNGISMPKYPHSRNYEIGGQTSGRRQSIEPDAVDWKSQPQYQLSWLKGYSVENSGQHRRRRRNR